MPGEDSLLSEIDEVRHKELRAAMTPGVSWLTQVAVHSIRGMRPARSTHLSHLLMLLVFPSLFSTVARAMRGSKFASIDSLPT